MTRPDGTEWVLGRGGMGVTYQALDLKLGRPVALKVIDSNRLLDEAARQRFLREAKANALLHHRNIAAVYHQGQVGESCFYAMELIEGVTLQEVLKEKGSLPLDEALEITRQAAQALSEAEKHGLVHRDIKPANLMLKRESDGELVVKLIDFGLVKAVTRDGALDTQITIDGGYLGTALTSSPEQCRGEDVDTRADIYSLGVVLWYMLEGAPPFEDGNHFRLMMAHLESPPPFERLQGFPEPVMRLLARMLAKKREDRPAGTAELLTLLAEAKRAQQPVPAAAVHDEDPLTRATALQEESEPASFPWVATLLGLLVIGLIGFMAWLIMGASERVESPAGPRLRVEDLTGPAIAGDSLLEQLTRLDEARKAADWADALRTGLALVPMAGSPDRLVQVERAMEALAKDMLARPAVEWLEAARVASGALREWAEGGNRPAGRILLARMLRDDDPAAAAALLEKMDPATAGDLHLRFAWQAFRHLLAPDAQARESLESALGESLALIERQPGREWKPALPFLRDLAKAGHVPSMLVLGRKTEDPSEAQAVLMEAARKLDKPDQWASAIPVYLDLIKLSTDESLTGLMKERVALVANEFLNQPGSLSGADWAAAQPLFERAAKAGIAPAAELIGQRLLATDSAKAALWFKQAAEAGAPGAMMALSHLYERGQGLPLNPTAAQTWLDKAAAAGNPAAQVKLAGRLLASGEVQAAARGVQLLERAIAGSHVPAMELLADSLRRGQGVKPDPARARALYQQAADLGSSASLGNLGTMWLTGEGGAADPVKALQLFQDGVNRGNAWCQYLLGVALWEGKATPQDRVRAARLLGDAAKGGIPEARRFCEQQGIALP